MVAVAAAPARSGPIEARRIAIVTSDEGALPSIEQYMVPVFHTTMLGEIGELPLLVESPGIEALVLDMEFRAGSTEHGLKAIEKLRRLSDDLFIVAISRSDHHSVRQGAAAAGADDFFVAPVDFQQLQMVLLHALERRAGLREAHRPAADAGPRFTFCDLIGASEPMRMLYETISRVAASNSTVLIRGESGAGKELVARAIQQLSARRDKPFISVNCAALPDNLIEAELFGHEKGAFTGAHIARAGHIENAHGGTLFLDEIATLGLGLQSKLLRVLEDHSVQRIGGKGVKKIDFRLITATNEDLEEMVNTGRFREDLYYRIQVVPISLPALRERPGDITLLVEHFLQVYCSENSVPLKRIDPEAMEVLEDYEWPGNVRELENLVQRLVLLAPGNVISVKHLPQNILSRSAEAQQALLIPEEGLEFEDEMVRIERAYLEAALKRTGGKSAAARLLHIPPQRMKYLCRKHGI